MLLELIRHCHLFFLLIFKPGLWPQLASYGHVWFLEIVIRKVCVCVCVYMYVHTYVCWYVCMYSMHICLSFRAHVSKLLWHWVVKAACIQEIKAMQNLRFLFPVENRVCWLATDFKPGFPSILFWHSEWHWSPQLCLNDHYVIHSGC